MNAALITDLGQAYRHHGAEVFAQRFYTQLFPSGRVPPNSVREETRIQRRLRKIMAGITKVHATINVTAALNEVWQILVRMVWPPSLPKAPTVVTTYRLSVPSVPLPKKRSGSVRETHPHPHRYRPSNKLPATVYFTAADADWWAVAWFEHEQEYWQARKRLRQQERADYIVWWTSKAEYEDWWNTTWFDYEQNYWKSQENLRERLRADYCGWWFKTLCYLEWWEKTLSLQEYEARQLDVRSQPVLAFKHTVEDTRNGAFTSAEAKADVGLAKLKKSTLKLNFQAPRKRNPKLASGGGPQLQADALWWKSMLLGNGVSADGENFVDYLIFFFGKPNLPDVMKTVISPRAYTSWLRKELARKRPRVHLSDKLTEKLFRNIKPVSPVNMSEKGYGPKARPNKGKGRDLNDPLRIKQESLAADKAEEKLVIKYSNPALSKEAAMAASLAEIRAG